MIRIEQLGSPEGISAIATGAGVVIFFFWDKHSSKARLSLAAKNRPPAWSFAAVGEEETADYVFVIRVGVANSGPATARSVEVVVHDLEVHEDGHWKPRPSFLPSALRWTHVAERQLDLLVPKTERLVDLAEIQRAGASVTMTLAVIPPPLTKELP